MTAAGDYAEQMQQRVAAKWAAIEAEVEAEEAPLGSAVEPHDEAQAAAQHAANLAFALASEQAEAQARAQEQQPTQAPLAGQQQADIAPPPYVGPNAPPAVPASAVQQTGEYQQIGDQQQAGAQQADVALPFREDPNASVPSSAAEEVAREGAEQAGETAFVTALTDEDLAEALPFPDIPELPDLSVEQYASLCVERRLAPEGELSVAQRYQVLTSEALQALDSRWRNRFAEEGELYQRWQHAYQQYEAWLAKSRQS